MHRLHAQDQPLCMHSVHAPMMHRTPAAPHSTMAPPHSCPQRHLFEATAAQGTFWDTQAACLDSPQQSVVGALFPRGGAGNDLQLCTPSAWGPVERPRSGVRQGWFCNQALHCRLLQPDIATGCFEVSTGWRCKGARAKPRCPQHYACKEQEFLSKFKALVLAVITPLFVPRVVCPEQQFTKPAPHRVLPPAPYLCHAHIASLVRGSSFLGPGRRPGAGACLVA